MSFLDKITANVTNAGRVVSQKTKNLSEANSLASEQRLEKRHIQEAMAEIAKLYVEKYKDDPNAEFAQQIASIKAAERRIEQLEREIELVRAREPELVPVPEEAKPVQPQRTPTAMVCMNCGRTYGVGIKHCQNCGNALIPQHGSYKKDAPAEQAPQPVAENWYADAPAEEKTSQPETPVDAAPAPEQKSGGFCPYCGKACAAEQAYCANCGKKL